MHKSNLQAANGKHAHPRLPLPPEKRRFNMKRIALIAALIGLTLGILSGCRQPETIGGAAPAFAETTDARRSIVCTTFPQYDWVRQILGGRADEFDVTLLRDGRTDIHSFQPTASDIVTISTAEIFIHVGGDIDAWTADALRNAANADMTVINLTEILGDALEEGAITTAHTDDCDDDHYHDHAHGDGHIWLSLRNAAVFCEAIADALAPADPQGAAEYRANLAAYTEKLAALDARYRYTLESSGGGTLVFGGRFPFRYLMDDYGIDYYAAFPGCSADVEVSFGTIITLADIIDEHGIGAIIVTDGADTAIAEVIAGNTQTGGQRILMMDAMQSVTRLGATYLGIMENNLDVLAEALAIS